MNAQSAQVKIDLTKLNVSRIDGADRYQTAANVSKNAFPSTAPVVYLATGTNFPDALAAAPAAATQGGPLLLVPQRTNQIPQSLKDRIKQLNPATVVVVGGTGVVSNAVVNEFKKVVPSAAFTRKAGADRYATGLELVKYAFGGKTVDAVYIATGRNFPDALSASAVAGGKDVPVILVDGNAKSLTTQTTALLKQLKPKTVYIAGGTGVVTSNIENQLKKTYIVKRLAGADRYTTSLAVVKDGFAGNPMPTAYFATGTGFADALSGAVLAGVNDAPMFVVQPKCVPSGTHAMLRDKSVTNVWLIGGTGALSNDVKALRRC